MLIFIIEPACTLQSNTVYMGKVGKKISTYRAWTRPPHGAPCTADEIHEGGQWGLRKAILRQPLDESWLQSELQ